MSRLSSISEKTLVPISVLGIAFGAALWLTNIWKQGEVNASQIQELKSDEARNGDKLEGRLQRIEAKIDRLLEKNSK